MAFIFFLPGLAVISLVTILIQIYQLFRKHSFKKLINVLTLPVLLATLYFANPLLQPGVIKANLRFHLLIHEEEYLHVVDSFKNGKPGTCELSWCELDGIQYSVDKLSDPIFVFRFGDGILDNWRGIIYDPSGDVKKAEVFYREGKSWNSSEYSKLKSVFGGDLIQVQHIRGPFYLGTFT